jgi:uncharacterized protein involved in exopolysaccharide biosynthesis
MSEKISLRELLKKDEIPLIDLWKVLLNAFKSAYKIIIFLFFATIIVSYVQYKNTPEEFEGKATVIIEQSSAANNMNGISSFLGLSQGPSLSPASGLMGPDMYKDIVQSQAFLSDVVSAKIPISIKKDSLTLEEYFVNGEAPSFYQKVINPALFLKTHQDQKKRIDILKKDTGALIQNQISPNMIFDSKIPPIVEIKGTKATAIGIMKNRIDISFKDKFCNIAVRMPDPVLSSVACNLILEKLTNYITYYKTSKLRNNISYLEDRYAESELKYKNALQKSASYKDNSFGIIFQSSQTREQLLNNEVSIAFNIYNQFAVQLEQARIELKKETPLFLIIEPISVTWEKSSPKFKSIILKNILICIVISILIIFVNLFIPQLKKSKF